MKMRKLGRTGIEVSEICLGTMTWGEQNTEAEGHEQLDYAIAQGINFIDTAELYAVPPRKETYGATEKIIGSWLQKRGKRDDLVIATKAMGPAPELDYARPDGQGPDLKPEQLAYAVDQSLQRLGTDYVDLYQLHWPSRPVNSFGRRYLPLEFDRAKGVPILDTLQACGELVKSGKVRHIGLSNETPWGTMEYLRLADQHDLPRVVSVQNAYSMLNLIYEYAMSEVSHFEDVGLLAYSPLASGQLSGKYLNGAKPEGARLTLFGARYSSRYEQEDTETCIQALVDLAAKHGLDPCQMAIAYTLKNNFTTSSIIGATKMDQLKTNIAAADVELSDEVMEAIKEINLRFRSPGC
ncbi:MAG: NADP(H)-dependent aldo-keto reductase [Betaproteobacteria bacterium AqS2]|uniref:Protein tas n=1 Tax=Candidatus Amphirhobacter heronislandensis TaxID=1732024 RepID=A0A930XYA0_9GAMM|nr:NADP(H)-dependent aldo-keto reductase [Betaproteobacteria bacterium AqS2]